MAENSNTLFQLKVAQRRLDSLSDQLFSMSEQSRAQVDMLRGQLSEITTLLESVAVSTQNATTAVRDFSMALGSAEDHSPGNPAFIEGILFPEGLPERLTDQARAFLTTGEKSYEETISIMVRCNPEVAKDNVRRAVGRVRDQLLADGALQRSFR